jgi:hypothetical protein
VNIIPTIKYIILTIKHKWFVFLAGIQIKVPLWNLLVHDLSKFSLSEAPHYGRQFYGEKNDPIGFSCAWNHHQKCNKHHWEYWVMVTGHNRGGVSDGFVLPMPKKYIKEMVADWLGATRAYVGKWPETLETWNWYKDNFKSIKLHPDTRKECEKIIYNYFTKLRFK